MPTVFVCSSPRLKFSEYAPFRLRGAKADPTPGLLTQILKRRFVSSSCQIRSGSPPFCAALRAEFLSGCHHHIRTCQGPNDLLTARALTHYASQVLKEHPVPRPRFPGLTHIRLSSRTTSHITLHYIMNSTLNHSFTLELALKSWFPNRTGVFQSHPALQALTNCLQAGTWWNWHSNNNS